MAVTWDITNLERHRTFGDKSDVINAVHWECYEVVGDHVGRVYGVESLPVNDLKKFIANADVTKDIVIGWAKTILGANVVSNVETAVAAQIAESKNPQKENGVPWQS